MDSGYMAWMAARNSADPGIRAVWRSPRDWRKPGAGRPWHGRRRRFDAGQSHRETLSEENALDQVQPDWAWDAVPGDRFRESGWVGASLCFGTGGVDRRSDCRALANAD